ncbi:MAG: YicC family protein [Clostridia bacterium]|nr:YicC family protein [Clostridia bacterium]
MIRSMTGYGRVAQIVDGYSVLLEIKSVNHRYFDFTARVPRLYGYIEEKLKTYLQSVITRGKVEVFVAIDVLEGAEGEIKLNHRLAESYIGALRELQQQYGLRDDISVSTVARYADIFTEFRPPEDEERVWVAVKKAADSAVSEFVAMRCSEGERLRSDIVARAENISTLVTQVELRSPQTVADYRARLLSKMNEVLDNSRFDETRILTEAAIYADKVSVDEETVRLKSHLKQFEIMLDAKEPAGRKLDFLMQEMNREANTIGSKASDIEIARVVVDIKAELEKIREQIQNIE